MTRLYTFSEWVFTLTTHWTKKWCLEKCSLRIPLQWLLTFKLGMSRSNKWITSFLEKINESSFRGLPFSCSELKTVFFTYSSKSFIGSCHLLLYSQSVQCKCDCTWLPHWLADDNVDIQTKCPSQSQHSDCPQVLMVTRLTYLLSLWSCSGIHHPAHCTSKINFETLWEKQGLVSGWLNWFFQQVENPRSLVSCCYCGA